MEEDNKGAYDIARGDSSTKALRHIDHLDFYVRDLVEAGRVVVKKVKTEDMSADVLTKPVKSRPELIRALGKYNFHLPPYTRTSSN